MSSILITGAKGFLGSALRQYLSESVLTPDLLISDANRKQWKDLFLDTKPSAVFHCAGRVFSSDQNQLVKDNVEATKILFETLQAIDFKGKIIIPGSAAEYGPQDISVKRISEGAFCNPQTPYGKAKLQQSELALLYAKNGLNITIARIFNILSKNASPLSAIGSFRRQLFQSALKKENKSKITVGSLTPIRDYLWIDDVLSALVMLSQKAEVGQIYNVCSGEPRSMEDILKAMIQKFDLDIEITVSEKNLRTSELEYSCGDGSKIKSLGWKPIVDFNQAIELLTASDKE